MLPVALLSALAVGQSQDLAEHAPVSMVRYTAILLDGAGRPTPGSFLATFSLYPNQQGGTAIWSERQKIIADEKGRYTVPLGSSESLSATLFPSGETRWLGVQIDGSVELPRVAFVSVPYAITAANADQLGGLPAANYVLQGQLAEMRRQFLCSTPVPSAAQPGSACPNGALAPNSARQDFDGRADGAFTADRGTPARYHIVMLATIDFGAFPANACVSRSLDVPLAGDGDTVALGVGGELGAIDGVTWFAWVSSPGVVSVRGCNATSTATGRAGPAQLRVELWKHSGEAATALDEDSRSLHMER
jgi:hypothetical protein